MLDQITYNRTDKRYEWTDPQSGEILTAPSKQKHMLFKTAVAMLDPDLYQVAVNMIDQHPQLERVVWKAVELVTENRVDVFDIPTGNILAMVDSSDGYGRYAVSFDDGYHTCQCEHWTSFSAPLIESGARVCKHVAAVWLWQMTRQDNF
ncbi:MAG: hypothetical protein KC421_19365 [Anaerolineales bacterium]|nr:hypothetical protein [Anaerolineales bacterium]